jgi:hypothetical protein
MLPFILISKCRRLKRQERGRPYGLKYFLMEMLRVNSPSLYLVVRRHEKTLSCEKNENLVYFIQKRDLISWQKGQYQQTQEL